MFSNYALTFLPRDIIFVKLEVQEKQIEEPDQIVSEVESGIGRPAEPEYWTNRIHSEDCAGVINYLIEENLSQKPLDSLYIATDCEPVTQHNLREWLAAQLGVSLTEQPSRPGLLRRLSNKRLIQAGYQFKFPTYREGYRSLINGLSD